MEMEDAMNEEERDMIRKDRAETNHRDSPFTRHLNKEMDNLTLHELACKPCDEDKEEEETQEADKPKQIWKPLRPTNKEVEEHNLTHLPFRNWCVFVLRVSLWFFLKGLRTIHARCDLIL